MVVVKQHRAVTRVACRPSSAPDRCGHIGGRRPWRMLSCDCNAAGRWRRVLGSDGHRNCDALPAQGTGQNATRRMRSRNCVAVSPCPRMQTSPGVIAELRRLHVRYATVVGMRHAFRQRAANASAAGRWDCGCAVCNRWPMSLLRRCRTGRMERKKNGGRSTSCAHRNRFARADYLVARRAYLLRIDICGLSLPSLPGWTVKKYSGFHHAPAAHQVQPSHTSLLFSI